MDGYFRSSITRKRDRQIFKVFKISRSDHKNSAMCYPYGAYNLSLKRVIKKKKCLIGITTENKKAILNNQHKLILPRIDTVYL